MKQAEGKAGLSLNEHDGFMARAIELAEMGRGMTSPNPMVGAVIVSEGRAIGEGYHRRAGGPHAEIEALDSATGDVHGSTMYVSLEPCVHQGRTPPCVDRIIDAGIKRVVVAMEDPNPLVCGKGLRTLQENGVETVVGVGSDRARRMNEAYVKWVATGLPFVTVKMAMSMDGKSATRSGDSRWISSEESRREVHVLRSQSDAVMVGVGTVLDDDPRLTVRMGLKDAKNPLRVVVDSSARTPVDSRVADTSEAATIIAVTSNAVPERLERYREREIEVLEAGCAERVDLEALLQELARRGVSALMVEGGPQLVASLLEEGLVDKIVVYVAPVIIGGREAPGIVGGRGADTVDGSMKVEVDHFERIGTDLKIIAYPKAD